METIDRYRIIRRLGAGSFATVWLGHDDDLDVPVAVKILAENWAADEDVRRRFHTEARLLRQIRDERVVRVYDIGTLPDGRPYFVMDFADAGSLADFRHELIPPGRALRLCAQGARAVGVVHRHGVIHRDVTPGNLLLHHTPSGEVRVLVADLGVAKEAVDQAAMTMAAGTPSYMAREQALGGALDERADVYSLAAVTYLLLTGHKPYPVRTMADLLALPWDATPDPIADRIGAPSELDGLLAAALSADPGRRPPTADVFADELDRHADHYARYSSLLSAPVVAPAAGFPEPRGFSGSAPDPTPGRPVALYALLGLAGLAFLAVVVLLTVYVRT